jgi:hypothetical protein
MLNVCHLRRQRDGPQRWSATWLCPAIRSMCERLQAPPLAVSICPLLLVLL